MAERKGLADIFKSKFKSAGKFVAESLPSPIPAEQGTGSLGAPSTEGLQQTAMNMGYNMMRPEKPIQDASAGDIGEAIGEKASLPGLGRAVGTAASLASNLIGGKQPQALGAKASEFGKIIKVGQKAADVGKTIKVGQKAESIGGGVKNLDDRPLDVVMNETRQLWDKIIGTGRDKQMASDAIFRNSKDAIAQLKKTGVQGRELQVLQQNIQHISKVRSLFNK